MRKHIIRFLLWCLAKIGYSVVPLEMERAAHAELKATEGRYHALLSRLANESSMAIESLHQQAEALVLDHKEEIRALRKEMKERVIKASRILPDSMQPLRDEVILLCAEEAELNHGSTDILGDSWLKFRRVASKLKKAHPELPKADIFKSIIIICEEAADVPA